MVKRILSLLVAVIIVASISVVAVNAEEITRIYFEVPESWENFSQIYCHIWEYGGDNLAPWQGKKERCTQVRDNLYEYDTTAVGGLNDGVYYGVIFSADIGHQTFDLVMSSECLGCVAYTDDNIYISPQDNSKTVLPAFWRDVDPTLYGPALYISGFGKIHGTCIIPGKTAISVLTDFIEFNLEYACVYQDKDYVTLINSLGKDLGLDDYEIAQAVYDSMEYIQWDYPENFEPAEPVVPDMIPPKIDVEITFPTEPKSEYGNATYYVYMKTPEKIENIQAIVTYDESVLEFVSCSFPNIQEPTYNPAGDGNIYFNASNVTDGMDFTKEAVLVQVEFKIIADAEVKAGIVIEEMTEFFGESYFLDSTQLNMDVKIKEGFASSTQTSEPSEDVTGTTDIPSEPADIVITGSNNLWIAALSLSVGVFIASFFRKKVIC
ncbi:MAG: hypothetical protein IKK10_02075 [Clostridia bacterium]|nr:hypothetical protein [Clostridia bacterium]